MAVIYLSVVVLRELYVYLQPDDKGLIPASWFNSFKPIFIACLIVACIFLQGKGNEFIYFQF